MRNPKHLARLYDALQKGDDEEEDDWQADAQARGDGNPRADVAESRDGASRGRKKISRGR